MKSKKKIVFTGINLLLLFVGMHCGYYSFSGSSLPSHIKTIAIPVFENKTTEFGVREDLTDELIMEFTKDNSLKVKDRRTADSILEGSIESIREQAGSYNREEQVNEIKIYMTIRAKYEDKKKHEVIWEETITEWGTYDPNNSGGQTRQEAIQEAIGKIVEDIIKTTITGW